MDIKPEKSYALLSPRVTVIVTTRGADGKLNAAPYSFVGPLSFEPPLVYFAASFGKRSLENAKQGKEFVLNIVSVDWANKALACEPKPVDGSSRLDKAGLETVPSKVVKTPSIKQAKAILECTLSEVLSPEGSDHALVIGKVVHASCEYTDRGKPDLDALNYLLHVTGGDFRRVGERLELERKK